MPSEPISGPPCPKEVRSLWPRRGLQTAADRRMVRVDSLSSGKRGKVGMARTPLARGLQDAVARVAEASTRNVSVEHVLEERRLTRTRFVRDAGVAAIGLTAFGRLAAP